MHPALTPEAVDEFFATYAPDAQSDVGVYQRMDTIFDELEHRLNE